MHVGMPMWAKVEKNMTDIMNVYAREDGDEIVGQAKGLSRNNLDFWDGHNQANGGTGRHLGLTRIARGKLAGKLVAVRGSDWEGSRDYAFVVNASRATEMIVDAGSDPTAWGIEAEISE